jgi:hypothetical protein
MDNSIFDLAHNTERNQIASETILILQMNNYLIEYDDPQRDRSTVQTQWRVHATGFETDSGMAVVRDRALLHISRRGRSSIFYNVYPMVIATIEFETQQKSKEGDSWLDISPPKQLVRQYKVMVKDIRTRMLKYGNEF